MPTRSRQPQIFLLFCLPFLLIACTAVQHDSALDKRFLSHDLRSAESLAQKTGQQDLGCANVKTEELSAKNAEGAPMGPVWTNYTIRISGCGKEKSYKIQCEAEYACFLAK
jgi:hypothetical protein